MHATQRFVLALVLLAPLLAVSQEQGRQMQHATVNGAELAYEVAGQGEPVLLIHGGGISDAYVSMLDQPALAKYQLIAYHRRGTGQSSDGEGPNPTGLSNEIADAVGLLQHLDINSAHVVGHSGGGRIALALTIDAPAMVHSLVLMEPARLQTDDFGIDDLSEPSRTIFADRSRKQQEMVQAMMAQRAEQAVQPTPLEQANGFMTWLVGADWEARLSPLIPDVREQVVRTRTRERGERGVRETRKAADLEELTQPVLWIWSDEPMGGSDITFALYDALIPQMEVQTVSGVRHALQILTPEPVAEVIAEFLEQHPM